MDSTLDGLRYTALPCATSNAPFERGGAAVHAIIRLGRIAAITAAIILLLGAKTSCSAGGGGGGRGCHQLERLWERGGGSWAEASLMAAIAMAESSGRRYARHYNSNGTVDQGYWQINSAHAGRVYSGDIYRPIVNARAAVRIRRSEGLGAWTQYRTGAFHGFCGQ